MLQKNHFRYLMSAASYLTLIFAFFSSSAQAAGTFQLLNFPTSTKVIVGQPYSFYINFLYSGNNIPSISIIGNPLPDNVTLNVGAMKYGVNGLDNVQITGTATAIRDYPLTLELTDNYGAFLTQSLDFNVSQVLPANAHAVTTTTWECNDGYISNGIGCQFPANGSLVGGQLRCNVGYVNYHGSCENANDLSNNLCYTDTQFGGTVGSFGADGSLTCTCNAGYAWNAVATRCDATSNLITKQSAVSNGTTALNTLTPISSPVSNTPTDTQSSNQVPPTNIPAAKNLLRNLPITQNLQIGASGQSVVNLQAFLEAKGFLTMPAEATKGHFGNLTKQALIAFQRSAGLPPTGYCGPMTRTAINSQ